MSDMSFKQAKELVERMKFSEITISKAMENLEKSSQDSEETLEHQEDIINRSPHTGKKLSVMVVLVAGNIGLIIGLLVGRSPL